MQSLPAALAPLAGYRQFITYHLVPSATRLGKVDKIPTNPATGRTCDSQDPANWTDFATASAAAVRLGAGYGVGFVFTEADPFWFVDIDHCLVDGAWSTIAQDLCTALAGAAVEVSSSGTALHIFGSGTLPRHGTRNSALGIECYHARRFVALTGTNAVGDVQCSPPRLAETIERYFPPIGEGATLDDGWWSTEPVPQWRGPTDDDDLIRRAMLSKSAAATFGGKASFADLWLANPEPLGLAWPADKPGEPYNASHADMALAAHLAFWTGSNAERIKSLMGKSMLFRAKWEREDYLRMTIRNMCALQTAWLADLPPPPPPVTAEVSQVAITAAAIAAGDNTYLTPAQQVDYFAGCVYIQDAHRVLLPDGNVAKDGQFRVLYGGRNFVMDNANRRTIRNAFEAFTENQAVRFPRADTTCFRPLLPTGTILSEGGMTRANTFAKVNVPRSLGDVSRFWLHLSKLFPNPVDREQIVSYMAACVQHQGVKFQWAPLVQGMPGNGKTMLALFVQNAIGKRYVEWPQAASLGIQFNAWLEGKVFYAVDEIFIEDKRRDVLETLKPMITGDDGIQVTKKGVDSVSRDICGNFFFLTNHRDGLRKSRNDRRIAPYFTPQQSDGDLARDGLTEAYFADLVDWLKGRRAYEGQATGYSIIAELLWTYPIPADHDPRFHVRAPQTSTTELAISEGLGLVEQTILEEIEQHTLCFRGGWVSSTGIARVLERLNVRLSPSKHREVMQSIGYDWHPLMSAGRPNNDVMPDGVRPRLYLTLTHPARAIMSSKEAAAAYSAAQGMETH